MTGVAASVLVGCAAGKTTAGTFATDIQVRDDRLVIAECELNANDEEDVELQSGAVMLAMPALAATLVAMYPPALLSIVAPENHFDISRSGCGARMLIIPSLGREQVELPWECAATVEPWLELEQRWDAAARLEIANRRRQECLKKRVEISWKVQGASDIYERGRIAATMPTCPEPYAKDPRPPVTMGQLRTSWANIPPPCRSYSGHDSEATIGAVRP